MTTTNVTFGSLLREFVVFYRELYKIKPGTTKQPERGRDWGEYRQALLNLVYDRDGDSQLAQIEAHPDTRCYLRLAWALSEHLEDKVKYSKNHQLQWMYFAATLVPKLDKVKAQLQAVYDAASLAQPAVATA